MGLIRKTTSVLTVGAVDFRSDKERTARYARQTRNAVRAQSAMQAQLARPVPAAPTVQPGWYPDPHGAAPLRWWDGAGWTPYTS